MPDDIPTPAPSLPTHPPMYLDDGSRPAGAGGWTPKQWQTVAISCVTAGAVAALDLAGAPGVDLKAFAVAFGKGALAALVAYMGIRSAGVRRVD